MYKHTTFANLCKALCTNQRQTLSINGLSQSPCRHISFKVNGVKSAKIEISTPLTFQFGVNFELFCGIPQILSIINYIFLNSGFNSGFYGFLSIITVIAIYLVERKMYITRAIEPLVERFSDNFKVVAVTGPRQVGKTTMLRHIADQHKMTGIDRKYVTLDNANARDLANEEPTLFLQRYSPPVLIDEIQRAPKLFSYIKEIVDESTETGLFWITGSQPLHLMRELSDSLAGRVGIIEMLGLSSAEIYDYKTSPFLPSRDYFEERVSLCPRRSIVDFFDQISKSSFPGIRNLPEDLIRSAYDSYIETYIMRDVRDLSQVADESKFRKFISACAILTSKPVVYSELARIADIDQKTAKSWLSLLVSTYLVKIVQPYSNNLLSRLSKQPIMHFVDPGLAAHLSGWRDSSELEMSVIGGQLFETFVFSEIYKSYINSGVRPNMHFFRTHDKKEIDLLLERNSTLYPIEIKKTGNPNRSDVKNFKAIAPIEGEYIPSDLSSLKRNIGTGALVCMAHDTYPITDNTWVFPAWAI